MKSSYKEFLDKLTNKPVGNISNLPQFTQDNANSLPDIDNITNTDQKEIINEIIRNFKGNIDQVNTNVKGAPSAYGTIPYNNKINTFLSIAEGVQPNEISHELVHANDHQSHNLYRKIWPYLSDLYNKTNDEGIFRQSLSAIQNKINPTEIFSDQYRFPPKNIQQEINHLNANNNYKNPKNYKDLFNQISNVLNKNNERFYLSYPSEFPAFISENLHKNWNTGIKDTLKHRDLDSHEQYFLHNILKDMDKVYPAENYPIMNKHIRERQNSIENTNIWKKSIPQLQNQEEAQPYKNIKLNSSSPFKQQSQLQQIPERQNRFTKDFTANQALVINKELPKGYSLIPVNQQQPRLQQQQQFARGGRVKDADIDADVMNFIEANKRRRSAPTMPNLHHDAVKRGFKIATSDPKEIERLLELTTNGTNKEFNDYLLNLGIANNKSKNVLDELLQQLSK